MGFFPLVVVSSCVLLAFFWKLCQEYDLDEVDTIVRRVVATVTWERIKAADLFTIHQPVTDLGCLLHKHLNRTFGMAYFFYPEALAPFVVVKSMRRVRDASLLLWVGERICRYPVPSRRGLYRPRRLVNPKLGHRRSPVGACVAKGQCARVFPVVEEYSRKPFPLCMGTRKEYNHEPQYDT